MKNHWSYTGGLKSTLAEFAGVPFGIKLAVICYDRKPIFSLTEGINEKELYERADVLVELLNKGKLKLDKQAEYLLGKAFPQGILVGDKDEKG